MYSVPRPNTKYTPVSALIMRKCLAQLSERRESDELHSNGRPVTRKKVGGSGTSADDLLMTPARLSLDVRMVYEQCGASEIAAERRIWTVDSRILSRGFLSEFPAVVGWWLLSAAIIRLCCPAGGLIAWSGGRTSRKGRPFSSIIV